MKKAITIEVDIPIGFCVLQEWLSDDARPLEYVAHLAAQQYVLNLVEMWLTMNDVRTLKRKEFPIP